MTGGENVGGHPALHQRRQLEQPKRIGHLRARPADAVSELLVSRAEVLEQLLVGRGLFQRVQLAAVKVFQECIAKQVIIRGVADNCGDGVQACGLNGTPAAFAHDEFIGFATFFG